MDENLWPVRNIAEYAYCPRLFYLMQVEGIFLPSSDTELGVAVHGRADRPSAVTETSKTGAEDPDRPVTLRSLTLSSESLGLIGKLDLTECCGNRAVPVEYRKGHPRRIVPNCSEDSSEQHDASRPIDAWPTDRVQVALQAMLLEEAGYTVDEAVIYYAEEKRRLHLPVDSALKAEALQVLENAKKCAQGARPLPLVNDPRCPRCSLMPVCLPDEVNAQRHADGEAHASPRKIWPPRDDGIHLVAQQEGVKIGVRGSELQVSDKNGTVIKTIPLIHLESLSVLGSVQVSTQTVHALAERNIPIAFLSPAGRLVAVIDPMDSVSAQVRQAQVRKFDRNDVRLEWAQALVAAKILNQRTLLLRNHPALPASVVNDMADLAKNAARADSVESVRGLEGQAAALYFQYFPGMIKGPLSSEFDAHGRVRRPPPDPVNAFLSFAYSMLAHECVAALRVASLEPAVGGFHVSRPGRPALALDLMEPFRPLIADSLAITCFNRGEITEGHFMRTVSGCIFTEHGRRAFFNALSRRMNTEITHPVFKYRLSYRRMIILHARMLAAWLLGEIPTLSFLTTR